MVRACVWTLLLARANVNEVGLLASTSIPQVAAPADSGFQAWNVPLNTWLTLLNPWGCSEPLCCLILPQPCLSVCVITETVSLPLKPQRFCHAS